MMTCRGYNGDEQECQLQCPLLVDLAETANHSHCCHVVLRSVFECYVLSWGDTGLRCQFIKHSNRQHYSVIIEDRRCLPPESVEYESIEAALPCLRRKLNVQTT